MGEGGRVVARDRTGRGGEGLPGRKSDSWIAGGADGRRGVKRHRGGNMTKKNEKVVEGREEANKRERTR